MSKITLAPNASGTGTLTVAAPNTNTDRTLTLPDATGTVNISGLANEVPAGSAGSPSVYSTGDSNTGVFFPAADTVAITTGGSERLRVNSSGNVGIGTSSPDAKLRIQNDNSTVPSLVIRDGGTPTTYMVDISSNATGTAMRIDASGNLLVGATAFSDITGGSTAGCALQGAGTVWGARADASGIFNRLTSNGTAVELRRQGVAVGSISVTATATTYNTSSDYRLKENVQPMIGALDTIAQLNPVTYTWKSDGSDGQGFIAHELQAVVPDCVTGEKDAVDDEGNPKHQGIDTSFLVATLVKGMQEQQQMIQALQADIAALKGV